MSQYLSWKEVFFNAFIKKYIVNSTVRPFTGAASPEIPEIKFMRQSVSPDFSLEFGPLVTRFLADKEFSNDTLTTRPATWAPQEPRSSTDFKVFSTVHCLVDDDNLFLYLSFLKVHTPPFPLDLEKDFTDSGLKILSLQ